MKSISTFLLLSIAVCLAQTPIGIKQNTFTTNKDPSFVITGAVSNLLQVQQYYVVSGAGESIVNGNYFLDTTYPAPLPVWTNSNGIYLYEGAPNVWVLTSSSIWFYVSLNGATGLWLQEYGTPPMPEVTIVYTGAASYITQFLLQNAGGLTVSNVSQYADTNFNNAPVFRPFPQPSNTNLATQTQLATTTNGFLLSLQSYAPLVMTNTDNTVYSSNPSHYLTSSATNGITQLGLSVVSVISNGVTFTTSNSVTQDTNTIISDGDAFYLLEAPFTNAFNGSYHSTQGVSFYLTNISGMYNQMTGGSKMGYSNTDGFVSTNWIHAGTPLTTNAYTYFSSITNSTIIATNSGTLIVSPIQTSTGIVYTLSLNVSNITYITNLNSVTLAGWGAFTTNSYSWQNYLAPVGDWQQATNYTNGLISAATAAATYQPAGTYLTPASSLNYSKFSNPPAIPTTNGLVTSNIFIGFATPAWVLLQNYLQSSNVAAYYATTSSVISAIAPYPTTTTLNASSNYLALANTTNVNTIALHWGINQALVASIIVNSNMTATFTTNSGVITVTLGSTTNLSASSKAGLQPASGNLTNWSGVPTNQILLTPNLVTYLVAGNNVSITYTTNSSGVHATVNSYYQYNSPVQVASAYIYMQLCATNTKYLYSLAASSGGSEPVYWPNALPAVPTTVKFYYQGTDITSTVKALLTNFSASATSVTASGGCGSYSSLGQATLQMVGLCY